MGDRHRDPTDHFRTTQPHAGFTMKDNLYWPGFILLAFSVSGMISTTVAAAYKHYEWLATTVLVAALGMVAGALWFVMEHRRVIRIDEQWRIAADAESPSLMAIRGPAPAPRWGQQPSRAPRPSG